VSFRGCFLTSPLSRLSSGFPARAWTDPDGAFAEELTSLMDSRVVLVLLSVSPFTSRGMRGYSGSAAALEEEAVQATFSSPPRCRSVSPEAYRCDLPTVGRRRASPVMIRTVFFRRQHGSPAWSSPGNSHLRLRDGGFGSPSAFRPRAVSDAPWRPKMPSPKVTAAGPYVMPPSPELPVATRWLLTSAKFAECDRSVLHGRDPAQVDFGVLFILLSSPHPFF
jgi:hypothetical protein